jgi:hypothetical protein
MDAWTLLMMLTLAPAVPELDGGIASPAPLPVSAAESKREFGAVGQLAPGTVRAPLRVAVLTEGGVHPMGLLGAELSARVGGERWSVLVGTWTMLPTTLAVSDLGSLNLYSLGGTVGACGQLPLLAGLVVGCVSGRGGALYTQARHARPSTPTWQPMASAGVQLAVEWPRDTTVALTVALQAWVPILRPVVASDGTTWSQPWVHGGGTIGLVARLW